MVYRQAHQPCRLGSLLYPRVAGRSINIVALSDISGLFCIFLHFDPAPLHRISALVTALTAMGFSKEEESMMQQLRSKYSQCTVARTSDQNTGRAARAWLVHELQSQACMTCDQTLPRRRACRHCCLQRGCTSDNASRRKALQHM